MAFQTRSRPVCNLCTWPLLWLLSRGGWWALLGTPMTLFAGLAFRQILSAQVAWVLLANSIHLSANLLSGSQGDEAPRSRALGRMDPGPVSVQGATGEVARVLGAADLWQVLEVPRSPALDVLKKAKRTKSLAVHPDKLPPATAGAPQAFVRVTQAYEVLSNAQQCRQYIEELRNAAADSTHNDASFSRAHSTGTDDSFFREDSAPTTYSWPCYEGAVPHTHKIQVTNRNKLSARYCSRCRLKHPARSGDGWLESGTFPFSRTRVFVCLDREILDITDLAYCTGLAFDANGELLPADTCSPILRMSTSNHHSSSNTGAARGGRHKHKQRGRRR
ncbi:hypothetical protein WJX73_001852 [Symbiochloris irregularis]|uniref:J domain-containing protein n=1 Tax=Symbiochloris irregularis TaxID=706552 RepID=A0AAW1NRD9_9CHLO